MAPEIMKGLKDVYFDTTESSFIDGQEGKLLYRGYNIHDLAEKSTFEEVVYLLLYGSLPSQTQLDEFDATLRSNRRIPDEVIQEIKLGVIEQQLGRRYGSAAGVPTQNIDPSIGRGLAVAEEQHGLRTPFGAVLGTNPRPEPVPKYPTPQSTITPRKPKQPSLKKKKLKKATLGVAAPSWGSEMDAMDAAATEFATTGKRFKPTSG